MTLNNKYANLPYLTIFQAALLALGVIRRNPQQGAKRLHPARCAGTGGRTALPLAEGKARTLAPV